MEYETKLFYTGKAEYTDHKKEDPFLSALAREASKSETTKLYFLGGHEIESLDHEQALAQTGVLLERKSVIIYEAAVRYQNPYIRTNILIKHGSTLELIEVKSKSFGGGTAAEMLTRNGTIQSRCESTCTPEEERTGLKSEIKDCWREQAGLQDPDFAEALVVDLWNSRRIDGFLEQGIYFLRDLESELLRPASGGGVSGSSGERGLSPFERGSFPSFDFLRALKRDLEGDEGTVFRYGDHENTFLNIIYRQLQEADPREVPDREELSGWITTVARFAASRHQTFKSTLRLSFKKSGDISHSPKCHRSHRTSKRFVSFWFAAS